MFRNNLIKFLKHAQEGRRGGTRYNLHKFQKSIDRFFSTLRYLHCVGNVNGLAENQQRSNKLYTLRKVLRVFQGGLREGKPLAGRGHSSSCPTEKQPSFAEKN